MRRGFPLVVIWCAFAMAACGGMSGPKECQTSQASPGDCLDRQRCELQARLDSFQGTEIEKTEASVSVTMCCDLLFDSPSCQLNSANCRQLENIAEVLKKYPETQIKVDAYTDSLKSEEDNLAQSETQAGAVKGALSARGVDPSRIVARGWGESKPLSSNATEAGRKSNRRLTITLLPGQP